MSTTPLTLAEAVPLGTVYLQRLLESAGVRSLVIKGPAFAELGVRRPKQSNDIDLLIHPQDREGMTSALVGAGWTSISHWFPPALDDVVYSTTFSHPQFPASVDVHHYYSGVFARAGGFAVMWERRAEVLIANSRVATLCREHALVFEALNKFKSVRPEAWPQIAKDVVASAQPIEPTLVRSAAEELGAAESASALLDELGSPSDLRVPSRSYERWARECGQFRSRLYFARIVIRSPQSIPRVLWEQVTLREDLARFWAEAHGVQYRSRGQVLGLRVRGLIFSKR